LKEIDLLIKGGTVFDGTGGKPFEADIGVSGDRIAFISRNSKFKIQNSKKVIDAKGLAVAPGFIDTHAHSEFTLLADPRAEGKLFQGVTTEISGNCGLSAAPLCGEAIKHREQDFKELGIKERWSTLREYFGILESRCPVINFATLVGHGNIRASVIGYKDKSPTGDELKKMQNLLRKTIDEGAIGLSTGLIYPPGIYSDTEELIELCKVLNFELRTLASASRRRRPNSELIYTSHMRSEGNKLLEAIEEVIRIGKEVKIKVHISHIKTAGKDNWHKIDEAVSLIENARRRGMITCDRYPYTAASTDLDTILPSWTYEGGVKEELKRVKSLKIRERIKKEILRRIKDKDYWNRVSISSVSSRENKWMEGKTLSYISSKINMSPVDTLFHILIDEKLRVSAIFSSMHEDNLKRFLSLPYTMICSDSSARSTSGPTCKGKPHPRGFGSFPRFLGKYVRGEGLMTMSEAIHKITMLPAKTFGMKGRGVIKKDAYADIVVFDPERVIDRATFDKPFLKPAGIYYVIVNGSPAVREGEFTGEMAGRILKPLSL